MENIIRVSGLGFEMEFDLKHMINGGIKEFYNSEDLDSPFCYIYKDMADRVSNKGSHELLHTLREYRELNSVVDSNEYFVEFIAGSSTSVRCSHINGVLRFFTREELDSCGVNYDTSIDNVELKDLSLINSTRLREIFRRGKNSLLSKAQAHNIYKLIDLKYGELLSDTYVDKMVWYTGHVLFMSMQKCLGIYVSKYLGLPIKSSHCSNVFCDKVDGRFSSTYTVVLEFDGVKTIQKVLVKSDNLID